MIPTIREGVRNGATDGHGFTRIALYSIFSADDAEPAVMV